MSRPPRPRPPRVIAHRGASAYAPENTMRAYELACAQGADCIELDLHATSDDVLVCIHDRTLERTTNVQQIFPQRARESIEDGAVVRHWFVHDFTLAEIRTLDCGSWFDAADRGATVQTLGAVLEWAKGRTTVLAELKDPEAYEPLGVDMLSLFESEVRRHKITGRPGSEPPVTVQSFHEPTVRRAGSRFRGQMPVVLLRDRADATLCTDSDRLAEVATFATGLGPEKSALQDRPDLVERAHQAGLIVTPWTFRAGGPGRFDSVSAEIAYYVSTLDVDAVITDNPDIASSLVR